MADELKPALTPEEWNRKAIDLHRGGDCFAIIDQGNRLRLSIDDHQLDPLPAEKRPGLAALCLHGQSFGFSHDDVAALETLATAYAIRPMGKAIAAELDSIAARIKALLPPEKV